jgi:hypothetical protein
MTRINSRDPGCCRDVDQRGNGADGHHALCAPCIFGDTLLGGCLGYFDGTKCVPESLTVEQARQEVQKFLASPSNRQILASRGLTASDLEKQMLFCRTIAGSLR